MRDMSLFLFKNEVLGTLKYVFQLDHQVYFSLSIYNGQCGGGGGGGSEVLALLLPIIRKGGGSDVSYACVQWARMAWTHTRLSISSDVCYYSELHNTITI